MLAARACRLLGIGSSSSTQPSNPQTFQLAGSTLEPRQRLARWKILALKLLWVLETFALKRRTQAALGEESYKRLFQRARAEERRSDQTQSFGRLINGEIMGRPLKPSEGVPQVDPRMCNHPTSDMKRRGNKMKWWTCTLCLSRWERLQVVAPQGVPRGREVLLQGPHAGKTFQDIHETEPQYAHWVRLTAETSAEEASPQVMRLAAYLQTREQLNAEEVLSEIEEDEDEENDI